jgi:hypothetical protein
MSTQNHTLKWLPPLPPPAVERYSLQYLCRQTSPPGIPTVLICMPHSSSTRKQNTGECNPTPQSLGPTPHHEATNTAITGSDTTPWGNKHAKNLLSSVGTVVVFVYLRLWSHGMVSDPVIAAFVASWCGVWPSDCSVCDLVRSVLTNYISHGYIITPKTEKLIV